MSDPSGARDGFPVAFSMGDPHGIGPEVILKALESFPFRRAIRPLIFGDRHYLRQLSRDLRLSSPLDAIEVISTGSYEYPPRWGTTDAAAGRFAVQCLRGAVEYCRDHQWPLLVTAPLHKKASRLAGFSSPGQTEYVASFFEGSDPAMAFFSNRLHLLLITVHIPLRQVPAALSCEQLVRKIGFFYQALQEIGVSHPRLALCGLNPHASEGGLFGEEEERILGPALASLTEQYGPNTVIGPFSPDTIFQRALKKEFDGVIALYHDQGLIPLKLVAFESAVNVTLGLPIVRTSPDHGTAFDIAGRGIADAGSTMAAIEWGIRLAKGREKSAHSSHPFPAARTRS